MRAGLVLSAACNVLGLAGIWHIAALVDTCQSHVNRGLSASHYIESSLAKGESGAPSKDRQWAQGISELRGASRALQGRLGFLSWLLPQGTSDAITEAIRRYEDVASSLPAGGPQLASSALERRDLQNKMDELAGAWLRVSMSLTASKPAIQWMFFGATYVACLLLMLLSVAIERYADSNVRSAAHFLEGMVAQVSNGDVFRSGPPTGPQESDPLPEQLACFSDSFALLARLLQGQRQVAAKVLDFLSPGVTLLSGKFLILAANQSFCRLVGGTPDSVQGQHLGEVFPEAIPRLLLQDSSAGARRGKDFVTLIKGEACGRVYRARLTEILHGEGDDSVFVLMLADVADTEHEADPGDFRKLYERMLESVSEAILLVERDGSVIDVSPLAAKLVGLSREELVGTKLQSLQETTSAGTETTLDSCLSSSNCQLDGRVLKTRAARKDGTVFSAEFVFTEFEAGGRAGYFVKLRDVTPDELADALSRERLRVIELIAQNQPLKTVLTSVADLVQQQMPGSYCVVMLKREDRLIPATTARMPAAFVESLGDFTLNAAITVCIDDFVKERKILFDEVAGHPTWGPLREEALRCGIHSSSFAPVLSSEGLVVGLIAVYRREAEGPSEEHSDLLQLASHLVSVCIEQQELNSQLTYRAQHDALTGLLNRDTFEERLRPAIAQSARHNRRLAVLSVDLDRFKVVNDTLGHAAGDALIRQLAARLVACLRETDTVARWGGDEFVIGLMEIADRRDAKVVAKKLLEALRTPFDVSGHVSTVSASIGISVFPEDGRDLDTLVRHADTAMYRAKQAGRSGFRCYDRKLGGADQLRFEMETQLQGALDRGEFTLHYHPQLDLRTRSLVGMEALLRWRNPQLGKIPPTTFIPIAEESGAIVRIGEWVIREACRQIKELGLAGFNDLRIAVNVSRVQFVRPDFVELVAAAIRDTGIDPRLLELELTESMLLEPGDESASRMTKLRALGIMMSIDDFGTGYSCLSYLQRLPIDHLKIDRSFVEALDNSRRTSILVESIVALAASLGMLSIAEGVELPSQLDVLSATGCNLVQGHLFCRPLPMDELRTWIRRYSADGTRRPKTLAPRRRGPGIHELAPARTALPEQVAVG